MGMPNGLLAAALLAFLAGAVSGLATWKRPAAARVVAFAFAVLGSLLLAVASVGALVFPTGATWSLPLVTLFPCTVRLDPLSAWFTLTLAILGLAVSVYSWEYLRPMERTRNLGDGVLVGVSASHGAHAQSGGAGLFLQRLATWAGPGLHGRQRVLLPVGLVY